MTWKHLHLCGSILIFLIAGCAAPRTTVVLPEPRPLAKNYESQVASAYPVADFYGEGQDTVFAETKNPAGIVTLPQALSMALLQNPALAVFSYEIRAAEARALQASLYPNPEVGIELENFAGSGPFSGTEELESTFSLGQTILLGGKRGKAIHAAALESDLAAWDYESARLDVFTEVHRAFFSLLAAQQAVSLNRELLDLSEQLLNTVSERVKAGKVSPAEVSRAQVRLASQRVELERAHRELESARQRLAAAWGSKTAAFYRVEGELGTLFSIPSADRLPPLLRQNPDLARYETALKQRQAVIALEDARKIPDPTFSGGVRRINGTDDNAFVTGVSIPLPLFDRNQGARREARYRLSQTQREQQALEVQLNAALSQAYNGWQSAYIEASALKDQILPQAQNAFETINEGYLQGRFDFLDVLDAQRTLFEARGQYLRALRDFHLLRAEIERLIGQEINTIDK